MVTYLLDTQVWLWMLAQPERLETGSSEMSGVW